MASPQQSAGLESDGFEAYVNMTLREASKMLAAEHQRLMQLKCHQYPPRVRSPSNDDGLECKRPRPQVLNQLEDTSDQRSATATMVARYSRDSRGSLGMGNRLSEDRTLVLGPRFSASGSRSRVSNESDVSDLTTLWTELRGQITPARGSSLSSASNGGTNRASTGSVQSELWSLHEVVPDGHGEPWFSKSSGPRISVMGAGRTSLHSISAEPTEYSHAQSSRLSIRSAQSEASGAGAGKAPRKTWGAKLSDVGSSALGWMQKKESASRELRNSVSSQSGQMPRSAMHKQNGSGPGKSAGLLNMLKAPKKKESNVSRHVSFFATADEEGAQDGHDVESPDESIAKPSGEVEPTPPPPLGQLMTEELADSSPTEADVDDGGEAKRPSDTSVIPIPTDAVKDLVVDYTSTDRQSKDTCDDMVQLPTFGTSAEGAFGVDKVLSLSNKSSTTSRPTPPFDQPGDGLSRQEDSLMARVAQQVSRSNRSSRRSQCQSPPPPVPVGDGLTAALKGDSRFPLLEVWSQAATNTSGAVGPPLSKGMAHLSSDEILADVGEHEDEQKYEMKCRNRAVITPNTNRRMMWDLFASVLVVYECIVIPLQLIGMEHAWNNGLAWVVRIFWLADMPLSFATGYVLSDGTHEMRLHKVAVRYLKTWFIVDLIVIVTDWVEVFMDDMAYTGAARAGKTSRGIRILRMARIARLFKFKKLKAPEAVEFMMETIFSPELLPVIFNLCKIVLIFAWINHAMACIWFSIGESEYGDNNWIQGHEMEHMSKEYIYLSAYHWSLQQFAGAAEVWPWNTEERAFAVIFGVITFVAAGSFVSSLTSSMTHFEIINSQDSKRLTQLKHFLLDSHISHAVALRVQRNAKHALKEEKRNMPESSIELIPKLSEPLRMEIHYDMHMSVLASHPFFRLYNEISGFMMRNVCHNACLELKLSAGDVLFCEGEVPKDPHVFFVKSGCMIYRHHSGYKENAGPGNWASEAGLWCKWIHCGSMVALEECTLLVLAAPQFQSVCSAFLKEIEYARQYGRAFLKHLNNSEESELTDLEDPEMDIEWLAMQTCPHFVKQSGLVGRLVRQSTRNMSGHMIRQSSTMQLLKRGMSHNQLKSKTNLQIGNDGGAKTATVAEEVEDQ